MMSFLLRRDTLALLMVFNAVGTLWGFIWYKDQLLMTPWYFWPLTPDCPLTSLCFLCFLGKIRERKPWRASWQAGIAWVAVLGSAKYGIWTVVILGQYVLQPGSQPDGQDWMLMASHIGLLAEGVIFRKCLPKQPLMYAAAMIWFLANDYADWFLLVHPRLPLPDEFGFAMSISIGLTVAVYFWGKRLLQD